MKPLDDAMRIEGETVSLRPITAKDTEVVLSWRNSPEVVNNFIYRKHISVQEHMNWLENKVFAGEVHQFIICAKTDGVPLGSIYLQNFDEENNKAEEGIFLGANTAYGKGIGTQAAKLMLNYAFAVLGLHKVIARVLAYNKASIRMHEKVGYTQEAYFKEELFLDGRYEDLIFFGAINSRKEG